MEFFWKEAANVFWNGNIISWVEHAMLSTGGPYEAAQIKASDSVCLAKY